MSGFPRAMYAAGGGPVGMMIDAPMLVRKLLVRRASSCHCECRSMMSPMGPVMLRGRLVASGGNHCCTGLVPACSAAVIAGLLSASCRLHSLLHCTYRAAPKAPGAVSRPCAFSLSIQPMTMSPCVFQALIHACSTPRSIDIQNTQSRYLGI